MKKTLKCFLVSFLTEMVLFFFGPYQYKIYSIEGFLYFIVCNIIFALGIAVVSKNNDMENHCNLVNEKTICLFSIIGLFFSAFFIIETYNQLGGILFSGQNQTDMLSNNRTMLSRISEIMIESGTVAFLAIPDETKISRRTRAVASLAFWIKPVISLILGVRWRFCVSVVLFFVKTRKKVAKLTTELVIKYLIYGCGFLVGGAYILILFASRGNLSAFNYHFVADDDMRLRNLWLSLYETFPLCGPIIKLFAYISHSPMVFAYTYLYKRPRKLYFGSYMLRIIGYFLRSLGVSFPEYKTIIANSYTGAYTGFVYGFMIDFGVFLTPIVVFFLGIIIGIIEKYKNKNILAYLMYPLCICMSIFAPYYYFPHVGSVDFMIPIIIIYCGVNKIVCRGKSNK